MRFLKVIYCFFSTHQFISEDVLQPTYKDFPYFVVIKDNQDGFIHYQPVHNVMELAIFSRSIFDSNEIRRGRSLLVDTLGWCPSRWIPVFIRSLGV